MTAKIQLFEQFNDSTNSKEEESSKYSDIKKSLLSLIDEMENRDSFFERLNTESFEELNLIGLNQDSDIYDFYLEHSFEIDELLTEVNFFDTKPSTFRIYTLYNTVIIGTQIAILELLSQLKNELGFKND